MQKLSAGNQNEKPRTVSARPARGLLQVGSARQDRAFSEALAALQLLTMSDVCGLLRISKPTLWRLRRAGNFPEPTIVTERILGWRRSEVDAWIAARAQSRKY